MMKPQTMAIRRKIIGVVLRDVRLARRRTQKDCARVLRCSGKQVSQYEHGQRDISLPELEALAQYLQVPVLDLLSGKTPPLDDEPAPPSPQALRLRAKIIGALMRKSRLESGKSVEEIAEGMGCSPEELLLYERGSEEIPALRLQALAEYLEVPFERFLWSPPQEEAEAAPEPVGELEHLPPEFREFLSAPCNMPYIQVAVELSRLSARGLRAIAEALLATQSPGQGT